MHEMLEPLSAAKESRELMMKTGILDFWVKFSLKVADYKAD